MVGRLRVLLLTLPLAACGSGAGDVESETEAVYERLLDDHCCIDLALVQEVTDTAGLAPRPGGGLYDDDVHTFSREIREAVDDLQRRSGTVRPLPDSLRVTLHDRRLAADSARALLDHVIRDNVRQLPDRASIVFISDIGFSRGGRVAVVRMTEVCGHLCGGVTLRELRKHPGGWVPAEVVWHAVF